MSKEIRSAKAGSSEEHPGSTPVDKQQTGLTFRIDGKEVFVPMSVRDVLEYLRRQPRVGESPKAHQTRLRKEDTEMIAKALAGVDEGLKNRRGLL